MAHLTDSEIAAALARGAEEERSQARACRVEYNKRANSLTIHTTNGCSATVPVEKIQGLEDASPNQIAKVELLGSGSGLHWEELDVDVSVPGLLAGVFGTRAHMAALAGRARSAAKAAASRKNGAKGGRPSAPIARKRT